MNNASSHKPAQFDAQNGWGRVVQLFGDQMSDIITELNDAVVA